jgi:hypothetical protein
VVILLLLLPLLASAAPAQRVRPGEAPLDTLATSPRTGRLEDLSRAEMIGITRKVLPDVQASRLPQLQTPDRPPRLDDPEAAANLFHLAQSAALGGDFEGAIGRLRMAQEADPGQSRFRWWVTGEAIRRLDPGTLLLNLPAALREALHDPLARLRFLLFAHQAAVLLLALLWTVLVLAYLMRYWHNIAHDLTVLVYRDERHRGRSWLALMMPLAVLLLRPGWFGVLVLLSIPLCVQARGRARWPLVTVWALCGLLLVPQWGFLRQARPALDPGSETVLLERASRLAPDGVLARRLEEHLARAEDPDRRLRLEVALAVQKARAGDYRGSTELFERVLSRDTRHVASIIGVANNTYYLGHLDAALAGYERASQLAPLRGEIPYNMAQAYIKKLFVAEGSDALKQARDLGFTPQAWEDAEGRMGGYSPVVYFGLGPEEILASARWEASSYDGLVHLSAWRDWLGCPPLPEYLVLLVTLATAMLLVFAGSDQHSPRHCQNCGTIVCESCARVREEAWLCQPCAEIAARAKSEMVLATLWKNRSRALGLTESQRLGRLARLLPGAGHVITGSLAGGLMRLGLLAVGLFLLLFGWAFEIAQPWRLPGLLLAEETLDPLWFPLPRAAWSGWETWTVICGAAIVVSLYLIAVVDGAQVRQRVIPERLQAAKKAGVTVAPRSAQRPV